MHTSLAGLIMLAGGCQIAILIASALVPIRLRWKTELNSLPRLHRQLYWIYGGYVVLSIIALGLICLFNAEELAGGSGLARAFSAYVAVFWGVRISLQAVLDVKSHLTAWWLKVGYHMLTVLFVSLAALFAFAALWPR